MGHRFNVSLIEVGYSYIVFALFGAVGSFVGGAFTDRFGRKKILITSLILSATSSIGIGLALSFVQVLVLSAFAGFFGRFGGPAVHH